MKKHLLTFGATLSLVLTLAVVSASAQTARQMTVTVPFDFSVGKTELPAGSYTVYRLSTRSGDGFLLRNAEGDAQVVINTNPVRSGEAQARGRLDFRQYGDKYFLARVWVEGNEIGRELPRSGREREVAKNPARNLAQEGAKPGIVSVSAQ